MIKILDEKTINKIAAGEVIERPASVIKELIENSIDAKATEIIIEVRNIGKDLIKIKDNGVGMNKEDLKLSFQRYATSKIENEDDLFNIQTLGFRGEALASIAVVSNLIIISKQKDSIEGNKIEIEGGKLIKESSIGSNDGTIIEVKELFFNTPARLKFLKSDIVELRKIIDVVTRYAIINNNLHIKLLHNGQIVLNSPKNSNLLFNLASIYGTETIKHLIEVNYESKFTKIKGFISKPSTLRSDKTDQSFFINKRYIKNDIITKALHDGYHSLLFHGRYPIAVLDLEIDPQEIDINVHPSKELVKITQDKLFYEEVYRAIKKTLEKTDLFDQKIPNEFKQKIFTTSTQNYNPSLFKKTPTISIEELQETISEIKQETRKLPDMKILGQIFKTFFLAESPEGLLLIDQHIVEERILYEKFMKEMLDENIITQELLSPQVLELKPEQSIKLKENLEEINKLGFAIEEFGDNSYIIRTVPTIFSKVQPNELVLEVINNLNKPIKEIKEKILTKMACVNSIKAGDICSVPEIQNLLYKLDKCSLPYTCPHGREIIITITKDELERMFRRK